RKSADRVPVKRLNWAQPSRSLPPLSRSPTIEPPRARRPPAQRHLVNLSAMLRVENLTKAYHRGQVESPALRGASCEIAAGSFTFIAGPAGSGKRTRPYLMGAVDGPTTGQLLLHGRPLPSLRPAERDRRRQRDLGFDFQSINLLA